MVHTQKNWRTILKAEDRYESTLFLELLYHWKTGTNVEWVESHYLIIINLFIVFMLPPPMAAILSLYAIMGNRAGGRGEKTHKCKKG